jgi:hypothetical protein
MTTTREEDIETTSDRILSNQNVKNVEGNLVEEIRHNLEDKRSAVVTWR